MTLQPEENELTQAEFCARFKAEIMKALRIFDGTAEELADHADQTGPTYWDESDQRAEGPEECARTDISYWEED